MYSLYSCACGSLFDSKELQLLTKYIEGELILKIEQYIKMQVVPYEKWPMKL